MVRDDAADEAFEADNVIAKLFRLANKIEVSDELYQKAKRRVDLGNPPGKRGSLGDAVNWEALLSRLDKTQDFYFVTEDRDYRSMVNPDQFLPYLRDEYERGFGVLRYYRKLSDYLSERYPTILLGHEVEKDLVIRELQARTSFASTHLLIAKLSGFSDFTLEQAFDLANAAETNCQVGLILDDRDVFAFYSSLITNSSEILEDSKTSVFQEMWTKIVDEDDDTPPF